MRPQAHVYYRQKDGNFVIHYSDRAHKWLLIAEDAGLVMDEVDGCIACADALDDDFFPPIRSTRWYVRDPHNGKHFLCNTVHVGVCMCNASPHCLRSVRSFGIASKGACFRASGADPRGVY